MSQELPELTAILTKISGDIGELKATVGNFGADLTQHIQEVKTLNERVVSVEDSQKRIKWIAMGAAGVLTGAWKFAEALLTTHK